MKNLILVALVAAMSVPAFAAKKQSKVNLSQDFESVGGDEAVVQRAKDLDPDNEVHIVQKRSVDRNLRLELGVNYGLVAGGETYYNTSNLGANVDFHINPRWSVGYRYYHSNNQLTSEGDAVYRDAQARRNTGRPYEVPALDYPIDTHMGVVNWYPLYGKLNMLDAGVVQFDFYLLAGYGRVSLASGTTDTYAGGAGVGVWIAQHLTTRLEGRYQGYSNQTDTGSRQINSMVFQVSLGVML